MKKIIDFLCKPFDENFSFFIILLLLISSIDFVSQFYYVGIQSGIYWSMFGFVESYFFCLFIPLFNKKWALFYKIILLLLGFINFITDIIVSSISSSDFSQFVGVILGTNINEILEFAKHYMTLSSILICIFSMMCFVFLYYLLKRVRINKILVQFNCVLLLCVIPFVINDNWGHRYNIFVGKIYTFIVEYNKNNHNPKDYYSHPQLSKGQKLPQNIVVVIGESLSKSFTSLYGYEKNTNPYLSNYSDGSLILYNNVTSAYAYTVENIECILSTFSKRNSKKWYECLTLQEILSNLKYKTYWISNQAAAGLWDNIPAKYANLCDSVFFVGAKNMNLVSNTYDENVITPVRDILKNDEQKVLFVHLMGSHPYFEQRYPKNRTKFKTTDYDKYMPPQREFRAQYDNSVVYNDSVVNEIFKSVEGKETLCFYFPDHGLDIYASDSLYIGHAKRENDLSQSIAKRIPFMIYASPKYQQKYPAEMKRMRESVNNEFVTENFIYALMDIMGVRFKDNNDVEKYTLFNKE